MSGKDSRLNVRMTASLKEAATEYAAEQNMTLSQLVVQLLTKLTAIREASKKEAEQV